MDHESYSESVNIGGETYDFDPVSRMALVPCENCGFMNGVEIHEEEGRVVLYGFSCEDCGHFNSQD